MNRVAKAWPIETARRVEARSQFVSQRLVLDKTVCAGRADGVFVQAHRFEVATFDARDLCSHRRCTVFEILRAVLRPNFKLLVVSCQSLEMLLFFSGRRAIPGCSVGKRAIEVKLYYFGM